MKTTALFSGTLARTDRIVYTPAPFARTSLHYLQEAGSLTAASAHESRRENLDSYLFFVVQKGSGTLEYQGRRYELHAGDCVFLDCRQPYSHRTDAEDLWTLSWVHFSGPTMYNIYRKYTERGGRCCFTPPSLSPYVDLVSELYRIASSDEYLRDMSINQKLTDLLTLLMFESWHPENTGRKTHREDMVKVMEYLEANYRTDIRLEDLADTFYINKYYLTRIFREQFGRSITTCLQEIRITRAKELLRFEDSSIESIAADCGMQDANYFSRVFKKVEGITPGEFRRRWRQAGS